jgi:hypothetical protein
MPSWVWVLIAVAAVVLLAIVVRQAVARRRTGRLQERFGPEYERAVGAAESKTEAEAELQSREERRRELDIRPLSQKTHDRYLEEWQSVQAQFVDDPAAAVARADSLIQAVMSERGYPVEDFERRAADRLAQASSEGDGSTEDLRQAMRHYRTLFDDLVEPAAETPTARERADGGSVEDADRQLSEERTAR